MTFLGNQARFCSLCRYNLFIFHWFWVLVWSVYIFQLFKHCLGLRDNHWVLPIQTDLPRLDNRRNQLDTKIFRCLLPILSITFQTKWYLTLQNQFYAYSSTNSTNRRPLCSFFKLFQYRFLTNWGCGRIFISLRQQGFFKVFCASLNYL